MSTFPSSADAEPVQEAARDERTLSAPALQPLGAAGSRTTSPLMVSGACRKQSSSSLHASIPSTPNTTTPYSVGGTPETSAARRGLTEQLEGAAYQSTFPSAPRSGLAPQQQDKPTFSSTSTRHPLHHRITGSSSPIKKPFSFNVNAAPFVSFAPKATSCPQLPSSIIQQTHYASTGTLNNSACSDSYPATTTSTHSSPQSRYIPRTPTSMAPDRGSYFFVEEFVDDSIETDTSYSGASTSTYHGSSLPMATVLGDEDLDAMDAYENEYFGEDSVDDDDDSYQDDLDEGEREWLEEMLKPKENPPGIFM